MSGLVLLDDIKLPGFFDYSPEDAESIRDKQYGFIYIVTHVRHKPKFINSNEYYYTNNFGVGWFIDLIVAINKPTWVQKEKAIAILRKEHEGKDLNITYPEHYCNIEQQRHLKEILALIKPNKVKILTDSPFVIQTCSNNELAVGKEDVDWASFKEDQIKWLKKMNE